MYLYYQRGENYNMKSEIPYIMYNVHADIYQKGEHYNMESENKEQ